MDLTTHSESRKLSELFGARGCLSLRSFLLKKSELYSRMRVSVRLVHVARI